MTKTRPRRSGYKKNGKKVLTELKWLTVVEFQGWTTIVNSVTAKWEKQSDPLEDDPTYNLAPALVHKDKFGAWLGQWGVDEAGAGSRQQRERL